MILLTTLLFIYPSLKETLAAITNCTTLRDTFAHANARFVSCALRNSRPIELCKGCVDSYLNVTDTYKQLLNNSDANGACINNFVNRDTLQIVLYFYGSNLDLWDQAKCNECFEVGNGTLTRNLSNETKQFDSLHETLMQCINRSEAVNENTFCTTCSLQYHVLNGYFASITNENDKIGICMDSVDVMNSTRIFWSSKCHQVVHNEMALVGTAGAVLFVTALFYVLAKFCTDKKLNAILPQTRFYASLQPLHSGSTEFVSQ